MESMSSVQLTILIVSAFSLIVLGLIFLQVTDTGDGSGGCHIPSGILHIQDGLSADGLSVLLMEISGIYLLFSNGYCRAARLS